MKYDDIINDKIDICNKYIAKMSLIGGCDYIFGIDTDKSSYYYGSICIVFTRKSINNRKNVKIPSFVSCIGANMAEEDAEEYDCITTDIVKNNNYIIVPDINIIKDDLYSGNYSYAFEYSNIDEVEMCSGIKIIYNNSFRHSKVNNVVLNNELEIIYKGAFEDCKNLKEINLRNKNISIHCNAFNNCIKLESVDLRNVSMLGISSFANCRSLNNLILPNSELCTIIGDFAFSNCDSLKEVYIPENIEYIGDFAFYNSGSFDKIRFNGSRIKRIKMYAFSLINDKEYSLKVEIETNKKDKIKIIEDAIKIVWK